MNPYELLGVPTDASTKDIRAAFRKLSKKAHPDVGGDPEEFKRLALAADVLTDPGRRKRYDETGRLDVSRITPERIRNFLAQSFEGVIAANDDLSVVNVQDKLIRSIENGMREAHNEKDNISSKIERTEQLYKRFKRKKNLDGDSLVHGLMALAKERLIDQLRNVEDAIQLAEESIAVLKQYGYKVDPTPEGPLRAGPTLRPQFGGRSSGIRFTFQG